jgi:hypothetical protein
MVCHDGFRSVAEGLICRERQAALASLLNEHAKPRARRLNARAMRVLLPKPSRGQIEAIAAHIYPNRMDRVSCETPVSGSIIVATRTK